MWDELFGFRTASEGSIVGPPTEVAGDSSDDSDTWPYLGYFVAAIVVPGLLLLLWMICKSVTDYLPIQRAASGARAEPNHHIEAVDMAELSPRHSSLPHIVDESFADVALDEEEDQTRESQPVPL
uniref:Uncharacterized protein n=1 Tax=Lotharella globosa TaxID=91324 RepID=A0A7S3Z5E8_9EUKA